LLGFHATRNDKQDYPCDGETDTREERGAGNPPVPGQGFARKEGEAEGTSKKTKYEQKDSYDDEREPQSLNGVLVKSLHRANLPTKSATISEKLPAVTIFSRNFSFSAN